MKEVSNQSLWNFEFGSRENKNVPVWNIIRFQWQDGKNSQNLINRTFCRPPVTSSQSFIRYEKNPDSGRIMKDDDDDYSQGCGHSKEAFSALTKGDLLQPHKSD